MSDNNIVTSDVTQPQEKTCSKCGNTLPLSKFWKNKLNEDGRDNQCTDCRKKTKKKYYNKNKAKVKRANREYYNRKKEETAIDMANGIIPKMPQITLDALRNTKEKACSRCKEILPIEMFRKTGGSKRTPFYSMCTPCKSKADKERYQKNKEKILKRNSKYKKERWKVDSNYRMLHRIRSRVYSALAGISRSARTMSLIGCSIEELKEHLQKTAEMNYPNTYFNIDDYSGSEWHIDHIKPCSRFDLTKEEDQRKCFHFSNLQMLRADDNMLKSDSLKPVEVFINGN